MEKFSVTIISLTMSLLLTSGIARSQVSTQSAFEFPDSKMGEFARVFFRGINADDQDELRKYDSTGEWNDHLKILSELSRKVGGITPFLLSFVTVDRISIYSKENSGGWVRVELGLDSSNQINALGIRKSFMPVDYELRKSLTGQLSRKITESIANELRNNYTVKKLGQDYADKLDGFVKEGKYDSIDQGDLLADILTEDLVKVSNDKHLQIIPPGRISEIVRRFGASEKDSSISDSDTASGEESFVTSTILEDQIGYINISRFVDSAATIAKTRKIFSDLKKTKGIIIDLRNAGGGDGKASYNLLTYFLRKEDLIEIVNDSEKGQILSTENDFGNFFHQVPLFVLTSKKTISAGEAFAYFLQKRGRAKIVGELTAGAGYRVDAVKLPGGFYFVNSVQPSSDSEKGRGWQGVGVKPDYPVGSKESFDRALELINRSIRPK